MSCYLRHMKQILSVAGIEVTPNNKKKVDEAIHKLVGVEYKDCSRVWKSIKQDLAGDSQKMREFALKLKDIAPLD